MPTLVTNTGLARIINALNGGAHTAPQHIGWGTGTTAPVGVNTTLEAAAAEARVSGTKSVETTTVTGDTYQVTGTLTAAGTKTISEAALFDALTGGNMYVRGTFTGIPLEADDAIAFTIQVVQAAA